MISKKLIIGAMKTTLVVYINGNVQAEGGRKNRKDKPYYGQNKSPFEYTADIDVKKMYEAGTHHIKNYRMRKKKRKDTFIELVENNFKTKESLFLTLTFDPSLGDKIETDSVELAPELQQFYYEDNLCKIQDEIFSSGKSSTTIIKYKYQDLSLCHSEFKKFIQRMNYRYTDFKYVAVFSKQAVTEVWHFHMLCNLKYIEFDELKEIWGLGSVYIRSVKRSSAMYKTINYCIKNMYACSNDLKGEKGYLASRNLQRNMELRDWKVSELDAFYEYNKDLQMEIKKGLHWAKAYSTEHKYLGQCTTKGGMFAEDQERICKCKYYTYSINSEEKFKYVVAKRKEKTI